MWNFFNSIILVIELVLILIGVISLFRKKSITGTLIFTGSVFVVNFLLYLFPVIYSFVVLNKGNNLLFDIIDSFNNTVKQFAGDVKPDKVAEYAAVFKAYGIMFAVGTLLAVFTTVSAAIVVFGRKIINGYRVSKCLSASSCDIVPAYGENALQYARTNKNTVLVIDENTDKDYAVSLMEAGYAVIRRKLNADFFRSKYLNKKTKYHIIHICDDDGFLDDIKMFISYLETDYDKKNVRFYIQVDERIMETVRNKITDIGKSKSDPGKRAAFEECITLFSKNELLARTFVEANPLTKYMPQSFIAEDTSIKPDKKINVIFIGFGSLSREIYRQFVINNQLAVNKDGRYEVYPVNYRIYDEKVNENEWYINGLKHAFDGLAEKKELYFPFPEMPWNTECIKVDPVYADYIDVSDLVDKKDSLTYILVDVDDAYTNMKIGEKLRLLLNANYNYHIFIHDEADLVCRCDKLSGYGDFSKLFNHDVIVNEKLVGLAKNVDKVYFRMYNDLSGKTEEEINALHEKEWKKAGYFNIYSNISLANNLRLKLGLLGLDYVNDGVGDTSLICEKYGTYENSEYSDYFSIINKRNALLAQEHFRWNAYHMMSGYLPLKKERIEVSYDKEKGKIRKTVKNNAMKKHACLTTYTGLDELSRYLAKRAGECDKSREYAPAEFDYYENDELIFKGVAADYLRDNGFSVVEKK